jgi:hypothetical protein
MGVSAPVSGALNTVEGMVTKSMLVTMFAAGLMFAPPAAHAQTPGGVVAPAPRTATPQAAAPQAPAPQPVNPEFEKDILKLLDITGAQKLGEQLANSFMQQFTVAIRQSNPNIPPRALEVANEVARSFFVQRYPELIPRMVQAYAKVLTPDDVKQMLAFYDTPLGRRLIQIQPALAQAGSQAGQEWGQSMLPDLQKALQDRFKAEGLAP